MGYGASWTGFLARVLQCNSAISALYKQKQRYGYATAGLQVVTAFASNQQAMGSLRRPNSMIAHPTGIKSRKKRKKIV